MRPESGASPARFIQACRSFQCIGPAVLQAVDHVPAVPHEVKDVLVGKPKSGDLSAAARASLSSRFQRKKSDVDHRLDLVLLVEADAADHAEGDALGLERCFVFLEPCAGLDEDRAVAVSGRPRLQHVVSLPLLSCLRLEEGDRGIRIRDRS